MILCRNYEEMPTVHAAPDGSAAIDSERWLDWSTGATDEHCGTASQGAARPWCGATTYGPVLLAMAPEDARKITCQACQGARCDAGHASSSPERECPYCAELQS